MADPDGPVRVVFVCWGNICRSPIAERVAERVAADTGIEGVEFTSAATSTEELANPMDRRAAAVLREHGYRHDHHRAHQITRDEIEGADLVIAMEDIHMRKMLAIAPGATNLSLLTDYDPAAEPGSGVPDPWYGTAAGFYGTLSAIEAAIPGVLDRAAALRRPSPRSAAQKWAQIATRLHRDSGRVWHPWGMHILVVDDDQAVRDSLKRSLEYNAYEVSTAEDGVQALARLAAVRPDAVIMDVMMPRLDGLETTRMLRAAGNDVPILVLTARDAVGDRVDGLDAGGDDYLAKPFALDELLARLRALVRRAGTVADSADPSAHNLSFSDLVLNTQTREVLRGSRSINLTRTEFALLEAFMRHPRRVLERSWLLNEVWGFDFPTTANSLEVYIGYLRRKTEASDDSRLIHTVRGVGYVLRETPP